MPTTDVSECSSGRHAPHLSVTKMEGDGNSEGTGIRLRIGACPGGRRRKYFFLYGAVRRWQAAVERRCLRNPLTHNSKLESVC